MAATASGGSVAHNHVQKVASTEWEDEAFLDQLANGVTGEQLAKGKDMHKVVPGLRSSFTGLRPGSAASGPKASNSGRRESFVGSLLQGIATAVGLHRANSPGRDMSIRDISAGRGKGAGGHGHAVRRLSSAAMMRAELQDLGQFGDLRNDSFTSPSCSKLRRRSSLMLPRASDASISGPVPAPVPGILTPGTSGDLSRHSTGGLLHATARLTCPGEMPSPGTSPTAASPLSAAAVAATAAALATPPRRETATATHPYPSPATPSPFNTATSTAAAAAAAAAPSPRDSPSVSGLRARRRSSSGVPPVHSTLVVEIPQLPTGLTPQPPPSCPPAPYQTRPSGSSLSPGASRSVSSDHLPPMTPGSAGSGGGGGGIGSVLLSVRDRPPTPRGGGHAPLNSSETSTLARVLSSFHLPDILVPGSGKSVTERRSSIAGGNIASSTRQPDMGMPRSRRNSISSGPSITAPSITGPSITGPTGPGGAAISASLAKRAAAAAAAAAAAGAPAPVGGSPLTSPAVMASGSSWSSLPRPSPTGTTRNGSVTSVKPPTISGGAGGGGILQDFQTSLDMDDEGGALAAVDAEFDRRFGQSAPDVPGAINGSARPSPSQRPVTTLPPPPPPLQQQLHPSHHQHLQPLNHPNHPLPQPPLTPLTPLTPQPPSAQPPQLTPRPQPPGNERQPRAPASERTTPQNMARRIYAAGDGSVRSSGGGGSGSGGPLVCRAPRRMSCSETMTFDSSGDDLCATDQVLLASVDSIPPDDGRSSHRMRLASIRLSYTEGIIGGGLSVSGAGGAAVTVRASLDLSPGSLARSTPAAWTAPPQPQPSPPIARRAIAPPLAEGAAMPVTASRAAL